MRSRRTPTYRSIPAKGPSPRVPQSSKHRPRLRPRADLCGNRSRLHERYSRRGGRSDHLAACHRRKGTRGAQGETGPGNPPTDSVNSRAGRAFTARQHLTSHKAQIHQSQGTSHKSRDLSPVRLAVPPPRHIVQWVEGRQGYWQFMAADPHSSRDRTDTTSTFATQLQSDEKFRRSIS